MDSIVVDTIRQEFEKCLLVGAGEAGLVGVHPSFLSTG
jgi:anti-anti-sigma regulatory factor